MERYSEYKDSGVEWLGEIPRHWEMLALKHILKAKKNVVGKHFGKYDLLSLTLKGIVKRDMENPEGKFPSSFDTYQIVEPNDFIFCNFDNEETPRAVGLSSFLGMITGAYDVLQRKTDKLTDQFLSYYFLFIDDAKRFKPLYKGLRKTVPFDSFMSYKIPVPSIEEQEAIVSYLNDITAKIDIAIAQQQKMIELLNERKQIIINNAVTKGLDPTAKMKPSGIPWLGNIPAHWEVRKLKYLATQVTTPSSNNNKIGLENIESGTGEFIQTETIFEGNGTEYKIGDILYGKLRPYLKKVFLAKDCGNAVGDFFIFRPNSDTNPEYLQLIFLSQQLTDVINSSTYGAKMPRVSIDFMGSLYLPFPPFDEQEHISSIIAKSSIPLNMQIDVCKKKIAFFQERKQIIINDVVTGKVKVI